MPSPEKLLSTAHQLLAFDKALARGIAIPSTERLFVLRSYKCTARAAVPPEYGPPLVTTGFELVNEQHT
jgi:hypothetical protein